MNLLSHAMALGALFGKPRPYRTANRSSVIKSYPEQSLRQKLRGQRRAQGGPGLNSGAYPLRDNEPLICAGPGLGRE